MDGGSGLNIMYVKTLDAIRISQTQLRPSGAPFHGIVPGKRALPLGQIDMSVTFGDPSNFRTETLTFEVVGFCDTYHIVFGTISSRRCARRISNNTLLSWIAAMIPTPVMFASTRRLTT
jgi:hypothetical protein